VRLLLLGAPDYGRDSWHDDLGSEAAVLGWQVDYRPVKDRPVDDLVRAAKGSDLLIWARTHSHDPDGDAGAMLRRVEDAGTATVGLHLDLYWGVPGREQKIGRHPWWTCSRVYTADGGARPWRQRGVTHGWCPPAFAAAKLGRAKPAGAARWLHLGRVMGVHGEHRARLVAWARQRWGDRFTAHGEPAETAIYGDELAGAVSAARCVLGDSAPASHYWSDRVVRVLGRGGVLAHPKVAGMPADLAEVLVTYDRGLFGPLGDRLDAMTKRERDELRHGGMAVVRDRHLWRHRLQRIAEEVL
jgi:hypothetical protein